MRTTLATLATTAAVLAGAASASAQTWTVWAGAPSNPPADLTTVGPFLDAFLPKTLRIRAGDSVTFRSREFHTATFLGSTPLAQLPLLMPDTTARYSGIVDSLGMPFWFNGGPPKFVYNPQVFQGVGSPTVADSGVHSSPIFVFARNQRYTFRFPRAGTYRLICVVHPTVMKGTIVVKPKRAAVPTRSRVAAATLAQLNAAWTQARALTRQTPPDAATVYAGVGNAPTLLAFRPARVTVPVGGSVTWVNPTTSEPHNIAFGDVAYQESLLRATDLFPAAPGAPNQVTPFVIFGSEPPGPYVYTGSNHGNGFLATPVLDTSPATPNPDRVAVRFTKAGTYHYLCQIHGKEMAGDVVVTG